MYRFIVIFWIAVSLFSCRKDEIEQADPVTSQFVIIGHAYGNPVDFQLRLYKKLVPFLAVMNTYIKANQYIFTGDIVAKPTEENWENVVSELDSIGITNFWIAPGNHDLGSDYFVNHVQSKTYFAERIDNNLFFILNTNFPGWTVSNSQLDLIASELDDLENINNIFVFTHQVWWANPKFAYYQIDSIRTNSKNLINGTTNFWTDAFPLFQTTDLPTYFFSGDIGSWDFIPAYVENHFDNFHFYASGIGGGAEDNVLYLKAFRSGNATVEKIDF